MSVRRSLAAAVLALGVVTAPAAATAQNMAYQAPTAAPAGEPQVLKIRQGTLKGSVANGVAYHLGIPFAPPPVGDLRWMPPGAPPAWQGERDATKAGPVCARQEDCLTLNVVRPASARKGQKLPVMVWIHGGAFVTGTSMGAFGGDTEGTEFAKKGVVVVSANHRLGRAGWFAHPALTKEGHLHSNYAFMDQIAALKWVKANIADFGGDPNNVLIFGESAGGIAVLTLMASPEAKGLFHKAIAHSSFSRAKPDTLAAAEANGLALAEAAGVKGTDAAAAAALRKLPLTALAGARTGGVRSPGRPYPVIDGRIITAPVLEVFAAGKQAKTPLIIGGNSNEASLLRPTAEQFDQLPAEQREVVLKAFGGEADKLRALNDFITVQQITEPDRALARLHTKAGGKTWVYYFSYVPAAEKARKPYGAGHTDEIRFAFGQPRATFAPEDLPLSDAMNAYWAAFAKTGDPDSAGGPAWPRWNNAREVEIEFGAEGPQTRIEFLKPWRDAVEAIQPK